MQRNQLVAMVAKNTQDTQYPLTQVQVETAYNALFDIIKNRLSKGEEIPLGTLGKLKVKETPPRKGHNPRSGEAIEIPARKKVVFSQGKMLKELLNP